MYRILITYIVWDGTILSINVGLLTSKINFDLFFFLNTIGKHVAVFCNAKHAKMLLSECTFRITNVNIVVLSTD